MLSSASMYMPRSRTDVTRSTITPSADSADAECAGAGLLHNAHHMTSVSDEFNLSLFDFIQLATSLRQSEIEDENTLMLEGWHVPLTWVSSADVIPRYVLQSGGWGRRCKKWTAAAPERIPAAHRTADGWWVTQSTATNVLRPTNEIRPKLPRCALPSTPKVCCRRCNRMFSWHEEGGRWVGHQLTNNDVLQKLW